MIGWPDMCGVDAKLVRAARIGLHLQPGEVLRGLFPARDSRHGVDRPVLANAW